MKKYIRAIPLIVAGIIVGPLIAFAIQITVPSAPGTGYGLVSTTTGAYIASSTTALLPGTNITFTGGTPYVFSPGGQVTISATGGSSVYPFPLFNNGTSTLVNFYGNASSSQFTATSSTYLATVSGSVGVASTSPGSVLSIGTAGNAVANFASATSTIYSNVTIRNGSAHLGVYGDSQTAPVFGEINNEDLIDAVGSANDFRSIDVTNNISGSCAQSGFIANGDVPSLNNNYLSLMFKNTGWTGSGCGIDPIGSPFETQFDVSLYNPTGGIDFTIGTTSASLENIRFNVTNGGNATSTPLIILSNALVGVGTTTPWAKLAVNGLFNDTEPLFTVATSTLTGSTTLFQITRSGIASSTLDIISGLHNGFVFADASGSTTASTSIGNNYLSNSSITVNSTNSTLTVGGSPVSLGGTLTADINLTHANNWTGLQTFTNASSSNFSVFQNAYFGGTATSTFSSTGALTLGANIAGAGFLINNIGAPVSGGDAANKTYVDNAVAGVNPAVAVQAATTQASDTSGLTYLHVAGIGDTFTGAINTPTVFDGHTLVLGDRVLIKNDTQTSPGSVAAGTFNGIYLVTTIHSGIAADILTRALDYDTPTDINNTGAIPVVLGTANGSTSWVLTSSITAVGTGSNALTYTQFTLNPSTIFTTAGNGLNNSGNTVFERSYIATATAETAGNLAYWGTTAGTPATLNKVATTSIGCGTYTTCTGFVGLGSASTISTNGTFSGDQFVYTNHGNTAFLTAASSSLDLPNSALQNSTISTVALGGTLFSHSPDGVTLTGSSYNGSATVNNWAINLSNANAWLGKQTFYANASSTNFTATSSLYAALNAGQVGIGTSSPWAFTSINPQFNTNIPIFVVGSTTSTGSTTDFIVSPYDNVGIGTTTPAAKLTVNGTVYFHGLTAGTGAGALCATADGSVLYSSGANCVAGGAGTVTQINFTGFDGPTSITTSGTITSQISTSSVSAVGTLAYWTGSAANQTPAQIGGVATTTLAGGGPITVSNSPVVIGASGAVLGCNAASLTAAGCLAFADFNTFFDKVGTSSSETAGQLAYWGTTSGTPAKLNTVATTTVSCSGGAVCTSFTAIGGGAISITAPGAVYPFTPTSVNGTVYSATSSPLDLTAASVSLITSNKVGIGTTSPFAELEAATSSNSTGFIAQLGITDNNAGLNLKHWAISNEGGTLNIGTTSDTYATVTPSAIQVNQNGQVLINNGALGTPGYSFAANPNSGIYNVAGSIDISSAGTGVAGFNSTTITLQATDVEGAVSNAWDLHNTTTAAGPTYTFNGETNTGIFHPATHSIGFSTNGIEAARFDASQRFGVGSTSPWAVLTVNGAFNSTLPLFAVATTTLTGSTTVLFVDQYGNVGVGTTSLQSKFAIGGDYSASTTWATFGQMFGIATSTITDTGSPAGTTYNTRVAESIGQPRFAFTTATSTITNADTLYIQGAPENNPTNSVLGTSTALWIASSALTGTTTQSFGLYVNAMTGATANFAAAFVGGNVGVGSSTPNWLFSVGTTTPGFYISSGGEVVGYDATNLWQGRISPTHSFVLSTATTTLWIGSTTVGYVPSLAMPFAGTLRQARCEATTTGAFLGIAPLIGTTATTPNYFVASTTVGVEKFTSNNTFTVGQVVSMYVGTSTASQTANTGVSCTFDVTETP